MGTLYKEPPLLKDLKVTIQSTCLLLPSKLETIDDDHHKSMFLSNIDQVLNFDVQTVHFFASHKDFPPQVAGERLKTALQNILVPYDFLAGRLKLNPKTGRLEIDCNGRGAGFVVASSDCTLEEIGDLVYPNPAFEQLVTKSMDNLLGKHDDDDQPLCILQVTSFKCGGFAMGISTSHATLDGLSFKIFLDNLAAIAAHKPLLLPPFNDRHLLAARSPPRVTFPHPELVKLAPVDQANNSDKNNRSAPVFDSTEEELDFQIFRLTSGDISNLKKKAKAQPTSNNKVSGFNTLTALVWKCKALSHPEDDPDRVSTILYAVNIRPRLNPPLPSSYAGNAVLSAYASATCKELREGPFWKVVDMVASGANRMTDEYVRSAIDWGQIYRGFPQGELLVSSWWKLGFEEVEYPWGCPRYSCPVAYRRKDITLLFPDIEDKNGVNVLVALPALEMDKFRTLFRGFISAPV